MRILLFALVFMLFGCKKEAPETIVVKDSSNRMFSEAYINPGDGSIVFLDIDQIKVNQNIELKGEAISIVFVKLDRTEIKWVGRIEPNDTIVISSIYRIDLHKYKDNGLR